jgi:hypothetical protein
MSGRKNDRPGSGVAPRPLDEVELELVRADMRYLIQKEKENGDWAKWEESQKKSVPTWTDLPVRWVSDTMRAILDPRDIPNDPNIEITHHADGFTMVYREPSDIRHVDINLQISSNPITAEIFERFVGRAPINDDLERCNCPLAGQFMHTSCGWCGICMKPKYMCPYPAAPHVIPNSPAR